jgi:hypothetical protein
LLGYAYDINYKITSQLITELIDNMVGRMEGTDKKYLYQSAKFRFAHAETVIPLVTALVCDPLLILL